MVSLRLFLRMKMTNIWQRLGLERKIDSRKYQTLSQMYRKQTKVVTKPKVEEPTVWQRLGLEGKSIEERANYWRTYNSESWKACEAVYPAEMREVFAENRSREKRWREYTSKEDAWKDQYKYSKRKTIAARVYEM